MNDDPIDRPAALPSLEGTVWAGLNLDRTLVDIGTFLDKAAAEWGDRTAWNFFDHGHTISYSELKKQVDCLAAGLNAMGVAAGDRVGIMLPNVPEFPLAWLALARLKAISVPINPKFTARELDFIATDTQMSCLLISGDAVPTLLDSETKLLLDRSRVVVAGQSPSQHGIEFDELLRCAAVSAHGSTPADPHDLMSIQFTSGTTGLPKGCMLTHEYWVTIGRVTAALAYYPQRILADHPFHYMQNQFYLAMALASGAELFVSRGLSRQRFMGWLHEYEIDFAWVTDALHDIPPSTLDRDHKLKRAPADELEPSRHRELQDRFGLIVREYYGSTEVGLGTLVPWDDDDRVGSGSIGIEAPFRQTKIIDGDLNELAPGQVGELCVRGPGIMLGYYNRPEINSKLLIDGGWFRTGDLCRKATDGHHYFVGRAKDMIRRSGENVAAQEVEQVLEQMPLVREAAVLPVPDGHRGEEVKAYIVMQPYAPEDKELSISELMEWCRRKLAPFKIPRYIEFVSELPRTSSGKVWKAGLKAEKADLRMGSYDRLDGTWR